MAASGPHCRCSSAVLSGFGGRCSFNACGSRARCVAPAERASGRCSCRRCPDRCARCARCANGANGANGANWTRCGAPAVRRSGASTPCGDARGRGRVQHGFHGDSGCRGGRCGRLWSDGGCHASGSRHGRGGRDCGRPGEQTASPSWSWRACGCRSRTGATRRGWSEEMVLLRGGGGCEYCVKMAHAGRVVIRINHASVSTASCFTLLASSLLRFLASSTTASPSPSTTSLSTATRCSMNVC